MTRFIKEKISPLQRRPAIALIRRCSSGACREKLQRIAETVMAEGWNWVVVEPEFDYQQAATARIEAFSKELTDEEEQKLGSLQNQLEILSNEAEQAGPADDTYAEAETPQVEIEALTEEVWRPEDIARAGAFVALVKASLSEAHHQFAE